MQVLGRISQRRVKFIATALVMAVWAGFAEGGLYNLAEPWEMMLKPFPGQAANPRPIEFSSFAVKISELATVGVEGVKDNPSRLRYSLDADLAPRLAPRGWPIEKKISLSAYLVRAGKSKEAIDLLRPLSLPGRGNFLVFSNLATAYQLDGDLGRAVDCLEQGWPRSWEDVPKELKASLAQLGWTEEIFLWYREVERYHLKLVKLRLREDLQRRKGASAPERLDKLFHVSFNYEAAKLPEAEKRKLPANALAVVQQLLIWLPADPRLYWLLGEIYHAQDTPEDIAAARQIFTDLAAFNGRFRVKEIRAHLDALGPPRPPAVPAMPSFDPTSTPAPKKEEDSATLDIRALLVGFAAGMVISFLAYWQMREIRRRRAQRQ